jgi:serine/threonine-protein kinase
LARDPEFVAMFLEEARLAARVRHPNVVPTLDVVADDGELFLVMEYVAGESLARLVRNLSAQGKSIPPRFAVAMLSGALEGLHAAHEATTERGKPLGLVHRDVSPQNVHVGIDGVTRVLDFGIAKATNRIQQTRTNQLKGKIAYMSPEQLAKGPLDPRTDVYAASVVLWEALTGQRLFIADDIASMVYAIVNDEVRPPSEFVKGLPSGLDEIVMKGLSRSLTERWSSARVMAAALERTVTPAPPREIAEWVHSVAGDSIDERKRFLRQIESATSTSVPPPALPQSRSAETTDDDRATLVASSTAPSVVDGQRPERIRSRASVVIAGLLVAAVATFFITRPISPGERVAAAAGEPQSSPPRESEPAIVIEATMRSSTASVSANTTKASPRPATSASHDECEPPYTVDARGNRKLKSACSAKR